MKKLLTLALALVVLAAFIGLGAAQEERKGLPRTEVARTLQSAPTQVHWPATPGKKYSDLVESLRGQRLTAQVVDSGPQAVIVIYGPDGKVPRVHWLGKGL